MNVLTNFEVTQRFLVAGLNMLEVCIPCVQLTQQFLGASLNLVCRPCVIIECCEKHGKTEDDLYTYLNKCISTNPVETVLVHSDCCRNFTDKKRSGFQSPVVADEIPSAKRLRSRTVPFSWKDDCLLCAKPAIMDTCHPQRECVHRISTIPLRCNLLECCKERGNLWASEIENRLQGCIDLVAAEARYHDSCLIKFMLKRDPKKKITATGQSLIIFTLQP